MADPALADLFPLAKDKTPYRKLTSDFVSTDRFRGQEIPSVEAEGLRLLSETAFADINHLLRPGHLKQLAQILDDPEATDNDRVAYRVAVMKALQRCTPMPFTETMGGPSPEDLSRSSSAP